jgi:NADPH:quinone reductase-like Zn-dependent oxidoreductase
VDAVLDPIGGAHVARSLAKLRRGGRLVGYGLSSALASSGSFVSLAATTSSRIALWNTLPNGKRATFWILLDESPQGFVVFPHGLCPEGTIQYFRV